MKQAQPDLNRPKPFIVSDLHYIQSLYVKTSQLAVWK